MKSFWQFLKENEQIEIHEPYYRIVSDIMHGSTAVEKTGSKVGKGTYWTPRWDAILFMLRSNFLHGMQVGDFRKSKIEIYKLDKAIMEPAPKEHAWAFNYASDAGEMVLVQALETPKRIYDLTLDSPELEDLVDQSFQHKEPIDYSRNNLRATFNNETVYICPNYKDNSIDIMKKNGWRFITIKRIKSLQEWDNLYKQFKNVDWHSDQALAIDYFFIDMKW